MLIKILNDPSRFEGIHPINRAQIVDDAMNLALSGRLDYKTALDITNYLAHETSYVPWKAGLVALGYIDTMLSKGAYYLEYKVSLTYLSIYTHCPSTAGRRPSSYCVRIRDLGLPSSSRCQLPF